MKFVDVNFVTLAILTLSNVRVLETMIVSVDEAGDSFDMIDEREMMWNRELRETEDEEKRKIRRGCEERRKKNSRYRELWYHVWMEAEYFINMYKYSIYTEYISD